MKPPPALLVAGLASLSVISFAQTQLGGRVGDALGLRTSSAGFLELAAVDPRHPAQNVHPGAARTLRLPFTVTNRFPTARLATWTMVHEGRSARRVMDGGRVAIAPGAHRTLVAEGRLRCTSGRPSRVIIAVAGTDARIARWFPCRQWVS